MLTAMVKAEAYNHGMLLTKYIEDDIDCFGVSTAQEGIALRELGIKKPIKVTGFVAEELQQAVTFNLCPMVGDLATLEKVAVQYPQTGIDLKLDSGMNRMGINELETVKAAAEMIKNNRLKVCSLSTHFAHSDFDNILIQAKRFEKYCSIIEEKTGILPKNASASSGLMYGARFLYDEVRTGLIMYGYMPNRSQAFCLRKAMSVTAPIICIKNVRAGDKVGYSGLYVAEKDGKIGIIRGGYFDGISRAASGFKVLVNGCFTRLIGSICMDLSFVILDGISASEGDEVVLLGEENDAEAMAAHCGTIPYVIMTAFKGRMKRIFYL
jgi:alanine racemase